MCTEVAQRWFLPSEVVVHNKIDDLWVVIHSVVYNLTELMLQEQGNKEILPILAFAGKDISWWFEPERRFKTHIHPKTGQRVPYMPYGPVLHVFEYYYRNHLDLPNFLPWWRNGRYIVGMVTKNPRPIKILNTLSDLTLSITVCEENTILEISERYKKYDLLCLEYTWYHLDKKLDMCDTLTDNGIVDQRELFWDLNLPYDYFVPTLLLKYDDKCSSDTCGMVAPYHRLTKYDCDCFPKLCE